MMVSFVLSFFPRDVLDEILNLIESVSEDFPSYSFIPSRLQIKDLEFWLFGLFNRIFYLNTSSCVRAKTGKNHIQ